MVVNARHWVRSPELPLVPLQQEGGGNLRVAVLGKEEGGCWGKQACCLFPATLIGQHGKSCSAVLPLLPWWTHGGLQHQAKEIPSSFKMISAMCFSLCGVEFASFLFSGLTRFVCSHAIVMLLKLEQF